MLTYASMIVLSVSCTLYGFRLLISEHVDQVVRLSAIKGIEIKADTLIKQKMSEYSKAFSNLWAQANMLSGLISHPETVENPEFEKTLTHQSTVF